MRCFCHFILCIWETVWEKLIMHCFILLWFPYSTHLISLSYFALLIFFYLFFFFILSFACCAKTTFLYSCSSFGLLCTRAHPPNGWTENGSNNFISIRVLNWIQTVDSFFCSSGENITNIFRDILSSWIESKPSANDTALNSNVSHAVRRDSQIHREHTGI